jgi:hypothetical protein
MSSGFVVVRDDGLLWDGQGWGGRRTARYFSGPPDAYADCALAVGCLRRLGVRCQVGYVWAAPQVPARHGQVPRFKTVQPGR